jgi:hypothetical protein
MAFLFPGTGSIPSPEQIALKHRAAMRSRRMVITLAARRAA